MCIILPTTATSPIFTFLKSLLPFGFISVYSSLIMFAASDGVLIKTFPLVKVWPKQLELQQKTRQKVKLRFLNFLNFQIL